MSADDMGTTETASTARSGKGPNQEACDAYYFGLRIIFGGFVAFCGLIGNVLTIIVMSKEKKNKTSTVLALIYLAIADFCSLSIHGAINWSSPFVDMTGNRVLSFKMKLFFSACVAPFSRALNLTSVYITVIVIWQRYVGVCLPTKAKKYVSLRLIHIQVVCVTVAAFLINLPAFCLECFMYTSDMMYFSKRSSALQAGYTIFYNAIFIYTVSYLIPIIALVTMTFGLVKRLKKMEFKGDNNQKTKQEMTFSLVVIVIVAIICQSFAPIRRIIRWQYPIYKKAISCGGDLFYFAPLEVIAMMINASSNFFVLVVCARGFRVKLWALIRRSSAVAPVLDGTTQTSSTTATIK